jgi:hypothetical protein
MCIIAIQPKGIKISQKTLKNCWDNNGHGAGIMYAHNGKIIVKKELKDFNKFMQIKKDADRYDTNIVIHFRIATSGGVNYENCHPFKVNDQVYFCHNGILDIEVPIYSKINDTQIFNNNFLKGLPVNFVRNDSLMQLIEFSIGINNKFVFLDCYGDFYIINENIGTWQNGAWYSNKSYLSMPTYFNKSYAHNITDEFEEDDEEITMPCECCGEVIDIENIQYDDRYDYYLCKDCYKYESYEAL